MTALSQQSGAASFEGGLPALFSAVRESLPGSAWLQSLRAEALSHVLQSGLPHRRLENWKYTDLKSLVPAGLVAAKGASGSFAAAELPGDAHRVTFDGFATRVPAADTLPDGLEIISLADAVAMPSLWLRQWLSPGSDTVSNLNLAFASGGALLRVGKGVAVEAPVVIGSGFHEPGAMSHQRSVVVLEDGAMLTLVEIDHGTVGSQSLSTAHTSFVIEKGAQLRHVRLSLRGGAHATIRIDDIDVGHSGSYDGVIVSSGAAIARHQVGLKLTGSGASGRLACGYAMTGDEHADYAVEVVHAAPHTDSRLLAKGVAAGRGSAAIQGRVVVRREAQKSDSHQMSRGLLLSGNAAINQKPELEIFADDVKCGHGATVGALDDGQLFYLQSRGIPEEVARRMLVEAFMGELALRVPEGLREVMEGILSAQMQRVTGGGQ